MVLKLDKVYKNYDDIKVLENMTFDVDEGEILCVLGPSGCGKSTILNLISQLISPNSGQVLKIFNIDINQKERKLNNIKLNEIRNEILELLIV